MASGNIVQNGLLPMPLYAETYKDISDGNVSGISLELFPHNQRAYNAACHLLRKEGKAAIIHPTGTGKSFIAFRLVFDNPKAAVLWLSPSEYIFRTQVENLKKSLLSGDSVKESPKEKMLAGDSAKENRRKGTELEKVKLLKQVMGNLEFMTYSKLMLCTDFNSEKKLDYIILDEFHRCGAAEWGKGVQRILLEYPEAKVLGLSATNVRYLDGQRDMAEELFEGCVASKMTLGEAVAEKILLAPLYVVSMYSYQKELERLEMRVKSGRDFSLRKQNEELLEKLRRSLEQADGLEKVFAKNMKNREGKYVVFCSGKSHMEEMVSHAQEWFRLVDDKPHIYRVSYDDSGAEKQFESFQEDESSHLKLLFCIDMLNEGVHVEGVDGVILLRPTVSPTLYLQQIGRGLAAGKGKEGQPVIFDIVNNFESLSFIDSLQGEFEQALAFLRCAEGGKAEYQNSFQVIDEMLDCRKLFKAICQNLSSSWDAYYREAEAFYKKQGHLEVKKRFVTESGLNLGSWVLTQRRVRAGTSAGSLSENQIKKLDAIGMRWKDKRAEQFEKGLVAFTSFVSQHGHGDTGSHYETEDGFPLGKWLSNMRLKYKKGVLGEEETRKLRKAGMIWDISRYRWEGYYKAAEEYKKQYGNLEIPCRYVAEDGKKLGVWLNNQKNSYLGKGNKTCCLDAEQIQRLEMLGICWEGKFESGWERKYRLAEEYYIENGNLEMPSTYIYRGENLGKWLNEIRLSRNKTDFTGNILTEERIRRLDAIGMVWEKEDSWEYRYSLSERYYRQYGNLEISQQYISDGGIWLGKWIYMQRMRYRAGILEGWKKERLDAIGMVWDSPAERAFEKGCKALGEYLAQNKEQKVTKDYIMPDGYRLGGWAYRQKRKEKEGKLTAEQVDKLKILGHV